MGDEVKRRLTGAAVLLLLAGLVWPLLFSFDDAIDEGVGTSEQIADVPAMPDDVARIADASARNSNVGANSAAASTRSSGGDVNDASVNEPSITQRLSAEAEELLQTTADNAGAIIGNSTAQRSKPRLDQHRIPVSYVVQVATFNDWNNAKNFKETLIDTGFKAYVKPPSPSQAGPYRIAVGPVLTYAEAEKISNRIASEHKIIDAIIRRLRDV